MFLSVHFFVSYVCKVIWQSLLTTIQRFCGFQGEFFKRTVCLIEGVILFLMWIKCLSLCNSFVSYVSEAIWQSLLTTIQRFGGFQGELQKACIARCQLKGHKRMMSQEI